MKCLDAEMFRYSRYRGGSLIGMGLCVCMCVYVCVCVLLRMGVGLGVWLDVL